MNISTQQIGGGIQVCTSHEHSFGTDALLLADFAAPKRKTIACDLGTGCGIIPLYWVSRGVTAQAWGLDIQPQALEQFHLSIQNSRPLCSPATTNEPASQKQPVHQSISSNTNTVVEASTSSVSELENRLFPVCGDLRQLPPQLPKDRFDLITCNPPYQTGKGILSAAPAERIARHEVLCTIQDVCHAAAQLLKYGGKFCVCQKPERLTDVMCAMRENRLEPKVLRFVAKTEGDAPWLFLLCGQKGANPGLRVAPVLPVYQKGTYSPDMLRIYGENFQPRFTGKEL